MQVTQIVAIALSVVALGLVVAVLADQASLYKKSEEAVLGGVSVDGTLEGGLWKWELTVDGSQQLTVPGTGASVPAKVKMSMSGDNADMCSERASTFKAAQAFGIMSAIFTLAAIVATAAVNPKLAGVVHLAAGGCSLLLSVLALVAFVHDYGTCTVQGDRTTKIEALWLKRSTDDKVTRQSERLSDEADVSYAIFVAAGAFVLNLVAAIFCFCTSPHSSTTRGAPNAEAGSDAKHAAV